MSYQPKKNPRNAPGKFYVTEDCLTCENCQTIAPKNFRYGDNDNDLSYVFKQPDNAEEEALCLKALEACPMETIGSNDSE
jgi:ferredoxin